MTDVSIAVETPLQDDIRHMVAALNQTLLSLTPREYCHHLTVEQMADGSTTLFVARRGAQAVAMGALKRHGGGIGEVKRMYTLPDHQGHGLGGRILDEIEDAESAFSGAKPRGLLRVDVQGGLARRFILPDLPRFLAQYPDLELYMSEGDRFVDLVREGFDCVLRVGEPQDSDMVARRVALMPEVTVASPDYVARFGMPKSWDGLEGHRMIGFRSSATGGVLPLEFMVAGERRTAMLPMTFSVGYAHGMEHDRPGHDEVMVSLKIM